MTRVRLCCSARRVHVTLGLSPGFPDDTAHATYWSPAPCPVRRRLRVAAVRPRRRPEHPEDGCYQVRARWHRRRPPAGQPWDRVRTPCLFLTHRLPYREVLA